MQRMLIPMVELALKEEQSGGTVDWPFMLCTFHVMLQVRLGNFLQHKMKIVFMGI